MRKLCCGIVLMTGLGGCTPDWSTGDAGCRSDAEAARWQPGCATAHNLAMLVDKSADLDRPRRETPRDAAARDASIAAYRSGTLERATAKGVEIRP